MKVCLFGALRKHALAIRLVARRFLPRHGSPTRNSSVRGLFTALQRCPSFYNVDALLFTVITGGVAQEYRVWACHTRLHIAWSRVRAGTRRATIRPDF